MKKIISLLMTILLINIPLPAFSGTLTFGAFEFCVYEKSVSITGFNSVYTNKLIIPQVINNLPVTAVNASADIMAGTKNTAVEEIVFPEGVEFIGSLVAENFPCITKVTLPSTLKRIGEGAFYGTKLKDVQLPQSLSVIGSHAFANTAVEKLEISAGVKSFDNSILHGNIGGEIALDGKNGFFEENNGIIYNKEKTAVILYKGADKTLSLPRSVKAILPYAFAGNTSLQEIALSENITSIGEGAFENTQIKKATIKGKITEIAPRLFYMCEKLENVTLPDSVVKINDKAFASCPALARFTAKGDIKYISADAFSKNSKAEFEVSMAGMASAYFGALSGAKTALTPAAVSVPLPRATFGYEDGISIERFYSGQDIVTIASHIEGKPVTKIADWAFSGINFSTLKIYAPGVNIGYGAFCGSGVKTLEFADNLRKTKIGARAFEGTALEKVKLADAVYEIGERAFANTPITEIVIPSGVETVGKGAFADCKNLVAVYFEGDVPSLSPDAFYGSENVKVYYKKSASGFADKLPGVPCETYPDILQDGVPVLTETLPVNIDGTVMLPLKEILVHYGYNVVWNGSDGANGSVTLTKGDDSIKLFIGSTYAERGGKEIFLSAAPRILNGLTRIPSRALADIIGFKVVWNAGACAVEFNS